MLDLVPGLLPNLSILAPIFHFPNEFLERVVHSAEQLMQFVVFILEFSGKLAELRLICLTEEIIDNSVDTTTDA